MKNIQIIDAAINSTFSIFQATDEEFDAIFPNYADMEFIEDFIARSGEEKAGAILGPLWERPILKRDIDGLHGTLFYGWSDRRRYYPSTKREADTDEAYINSSQRALFRQKL